ncbi:MAG: ABC transporter substrate-binding protein [Deltaproteobacteria bacterium]|nr:ABC transporter substrate-binding protein [Deltaproteobacteria bacterium]MBI3075885.1 ABC transporter substrate-binding protein [Deltaproteobacteria bacterium]
MRLRKSGGASVLATLFSIAMIGLAAPAVLAQGPRAPDKVHVGYQALASYTPLFQGIEKGYFREQGLDVTFTRFSTGGRMSLPLANGEIDVGGDQLSPAMVNSMATGVGTKVVAGRGRMPLEPGKGTSALVIRGDLADQIRTPADLKGRTMLLIAPGSPHLFFLGEYFRRFGFTEDDMQYKYMQFPNMPLALMNKQADAAYIVEPFGLKAVELGAKVLARAGDIAPGAVVSVLQYSGAFIKRPAVAQKFMNAYIQGARYFNRPEYREDNAAILSKWSKVPKEVILKLDFVTVEADGEVNRKSIDEQLAWFYKKGLVKTLVTSADIVDTRFVDEANRVIGGHR